MGAGWSVLVRSFLGNSDSSARALPFSEPFIYSVFARCSCEFRSVLVLLC